MSSEPIRLFDSIFETARSQSKPAFDARLDKLTEDFRNQDNIVGGWPIHEAYLGLILSAANADGVLADEERTEIQALSKRSRVLRQLNDGQLASVCHSVVQRLEKPNALKEACESLPGAMRMSIFAHCVDVILADREFRPVEEEFLKKLVNLLDLLPSEAAAMMQSLLVKNRF